MSCRKRGSKQQCSSCVQPPQPPCCPAPPQNNCCDDEEEIPTFCITFPKGRMPQITTCCPQPKPPCCEPCAPPEEPEECCEDDDEDECDACGESDDCGEETCAQRDNVPGCDDDAPTIVIDMGSGFTKAGFSGELCPRIEFPTIIGRPKAHLQVPLSEFQIPKVGNDAIACKKSLNFTRPIEGGIVNSWCDAEAIYETIFCKLQVDACGSSVLLTEPPLNPAENREKMVQIMFERYRVGQLYVAVQAVMALYFNGISTGVVVDIGDDLMQTVPIYEGHAMPHASFRTELGGRHLTDYMMRLLSESGYQFSSFEERTEINGIKENYCYVAPDFCRALKNASCAEKQCVTLCDGRTIQLGEEPFRCPEALFQPEFLGLNVRPLHESIFQSVLLSDECIQKCLLSNIVLSGGSSMFSGIARRVTKEVRCLVNCPQTCVKTIAQKKRKNSVWTGASLLASLSCYKQMTIKACEYWEQGPRIVHTKCF